ncbi:hypothetical protein [Glycomyces xiaoerkulensis]|uniref:hypothetical protein n=1 Tax=Glycomyces xiaoerkulensis TaxID=2038139 RepID=UPI000C25DEF6|nr:hypothetical protein [Glycomyces xiaoerkulensis]
MTPAELHRAAITALAFGDEARHRRLTQRFDRHDPESAFDHLEAVATVCLVDRFCGPGPVDHRVLAAFLDELRATATGTAPPPNFLEVEGAIRSVLGEPHLSSEIPPGRRTEALVIVLRYLTDTTAAIRGDFDAVIDHARELLQDRLPA